MTIRKHTKLHEPRGIQMTIMMTFMVVSLVSLTFVSVVLYSRFAASQRQSMLQDTESRLTQTRHSIEDYLVSMRQISDTVYYNVITETDISDASLSQEMALMYESYRDSLVSIALYDETGNLITAAPIIAQKRDPGVTRQSWFQDAMSEIENVHFGVPHVQNLFDDGRGNYDWVISVSRVVDIVDGNRIRTGVLLVDMNYDMITETMTQLNETDNGQYYYLCDSNGELIYHPRKALISEGRAQEDSIYAASCADGHTQDTLDGSGRDLIISTIGYTGWRLVGVVPDNTYASGNLNFQYFIILVGIIVAMLLLMVNRMVAARISRPILQLDEAVRAHEAGGVERIPDTGPLEIRHLGSSIQHSYEQNDALMDRIVIEQTERRRSEFEALQSQINPHFLYNTLDSITWMVEGERNDDAVYMISELGRLLRISLSKGHTIISVGDELQHSQSYMNIQKARYRDRFAVTFAMDSAILNCCCVKLMMQPILENAIYYGVGNMDPDDDGEITVTGRQEEKDIVITIVDNGPGMPSEEAARLLQRGNTVPKHGSGVGLVNVHSRIGIVFGRAYGLSIQSEPDCGMQVTIRFPAIPYNEENQRRLERGSLAEGEENRYETTT